MDLGAQYDLTLCSGERFDLVFTCVGPDGLVVPLAGFTAVMVIYQGADPSLTSGGDTPDLLVTTEPDGREGEIDLTIGGDVVSTLFTPYSMNPQFYSYRLDLVDDLLNDNIIPLLYGYVFIGRKFGQ